jgi:hypothetical protein
VPLNLLYETLPLIRAFSSSVRSLLSPDNNESGEKIFYFKELIWHEIFTLFYHLKLCPVNEHYLLLLAVFIALTNNGDNEVHKYNVPNNQYE